MDRTKGILWLEAFKGRLIICLGWWHHLMWIISAIFRCALLETYLDEDNDIGENKKELVCGETWSATKVLVEN